MKQAKTNHEKLQKKLTSQSGNNPRQITINLFMKQLCASHEIITGQSRNILLLKTRLGQCTTRSLFWDSVLPEVCFGTVYCQKSVFWDSVLPEVCLGQCIYCRKSEIETAIAQHKNQDGGGFVCFPLYCGDTLMRQSSTWGFYFWNLELTSSH